MPTISGTSAWNRTLGWTIQNNPWGAGSLTYGTDYTMSIAYNDKNLSDHPTFNWSFPALTNANRYTVYAYPEIMFGASPWGTNSNSIDPLGVFPLGVSDLSSLTVKYNVGMTGFDGGHNVAFEIWLTNTKGGGSTAITNEVMVLFHLATMYGTSGSIGTFTSGTYSGTIYNNANWSSGWDFTTVQPGTGTQPGADEMSGSFDMAALLSELKTQGIIKGTEYICGLEFGAELTAGTGSMTFNQLEYDITNKDGTTTILGGTTGTGGNDIIQGSNASETLSGGAGADTLYGFAGNDTLDGGSNVDTAVFSGNESAYSLTQTSTGVWQVVGSGGTDTLTNIEYAKFDDQTVRLLPGTGATIDWNADPSTYMAAIRDFDGNDLGGASSWKLIGTAVVNTSGTTEHIFFNRQIGRWAEVGTESDGKTYFDNHGWAGDTRVVGIYIDPLVANGTVVAGSDFDSQRRFQNDLMIDNIKGILGYGDYNHDGLEEVYFSLTDGTAYLHAYMHADGNIQYANYQNQQQVIDYLTNNGWSSNTWAGWFPASQTPMLAGTGGY